MEAIAACVAFAQQTKPVDDSMLRNASPDEWVTYGRDYAETLFSPLKQINAQNVSRLGLAWSWETGTEGGIETTPLISNGVFVWYRPLERRVRRGCPHRQAKVAL
jgi:quinohemoprotein ethanol dehydrogenase